ncbi:MAG TPA: ATP-binding protein [Thermoanaerobaculia bacterium]|nr:ATP-binding protein [Thermoanaerobaculia bacterium]
MRTVESEIGAILAGSISEITQRSIFRRLGGMARAPLQHLTTQDRHAIQTELESSVRLFAPAKSAQLIASCARALALLGAPGGPADPQPGSSLPAGPFAVHRSGTHDGRTAPAAPTGSTGSLAMGGDKRLAIDSEKDIASARLEAWAEAVRIGLSKFTSVKVATAVSELARNIVFYAGRGTIELRPRQDTRETRLEIVAADQGSGIEPEKLDAIFAGTFRSERGLGKGLVAVQKLVDEFQIDTRPGRGTRVSCVFRGAR